LAGGGMEIIRCIGIGVNIFFNPHKNPASEAILTL